MSVSQTFQGPPRSRRQAWLRAVAWVLVLLAIALGGWAGYTLSTQQGQRALQAEANHRLDLFAAVVESRIRRLEPVPATIQLSGEVLALLRLPGDPARLAEAQLTLRRLNAHLGSRALFVMDVRGQVLASSNTEVSDDSLVGGDVAHRPYFQEALSGRVGRHFAVGGRQGEPGYFVSHPIRDGAQVVGVAAIKIGLGPIEEVWPMLGGPALISDENQVVILSSQPEWRYTSLTELPLERRVVLQISQLYAGKRVERFPLPVQLSVDEDSQMVDGVLRAPPGALPRGTSPLMLAQGRALDGMDWRVLLFTDLQPVRAQAVRYALLCAVTVAFVALLLLFMAQRRRLARQKREAQLLLERVNAQLESKVAQRTQALSAANARLRSEVAEREQAERTLRAAQNELVHAGKMAVLGQLATGITHELTQPLGAIRTLSGNAREFLRRGDTEAVGGNLDIVARLADQMGGIITPLKSFGRKSSPQPAATEVAVAVRNALFLFDQRLRKQQVGLDNRCTAEAQLPEVWCDPNRLEQVLINLIGNALDALGEPAPGGAPLRLRLDAAVVAADPALPATPGPWLRLRVSDSGPGFDPATRAQIFEPFFTTKPAGVGLGLGLAISRDIVRDFGGEILAEAQPGPEGGACFVLLLPLAASRTAPAAALAAAPAVAPAPGAAAAPPPSRPAPPLADPSPP